MIDPKEFLNKKEEVVEDFRVDIAGSFLCDECKETTYKGKLDEDKMIISWICKNGHESEAKLRP